MVTLLLAEEREKADRHLRATRVIADQRFRRTMNAVFNAALDLLRDATTEGETDADKPL